MQVVITLVALAIDFFIPYIFALDSKYAHYISKFICFVHETYTKCHLRWANERGLTLKVKRLNPNTKLDYFKPT
jgi:hypothetical protein